jgi:NADH:ubiquinone reductase (H+-translocating)
MNIPHPRKRVLIVGGGFGGVKAAQILSKDKRFHVRLVDPKSFMEYHAATYRMTTGRSAMEVCIPYRDLLKYTETELIRDAITAIDPVKKEATGQSGSVYGYDYLIFGVGCESSYFGIEGVEQNAFSINSVDDALVLRSHIHDLFDKVKVAKPDEKAALLHIAVIGGGASGVELAGELAWYTRMLSRQHAIDASLVSIDLIEAMPRLLPLLPEKLSAYALQRLRTLGVNVYLNRSVVKETIDTLFLKDMQMTTKTVVWTAGLKGNRLAASIPGLALDKRGRIVVDGFLRPAGTDGMYVIGDVASTKYSGMAQTALADAAYAASAILAEADSRKVPPYTQPAPAYAVPVGPGAAVVLWHGLQFTGSVGWFLRRAADMRAFLSMLKPLDAIRTFLSGFMPSETCPVCR